MKTLIFSIYISRLSVYQWEVEMFLNSLLTWSLGQAACKCWVAGVKIGDRGILGAVRSGLQHARPAGPRDLFHHMNTYSRLSRCLLFRHPRIPSITPKWTASALFSMPPLLRFYHRAHTTPEGELHTHSPLSQSCSWRRAVTMTNNASQAVE